MSFSPLEKRCVGKRHWNKEFIQTPVSSSSNLLYYHSLNIKVTLQGDYCQPETPGFMFRVYIS